MRKKIVIPQDFSDLAEIYVFPTLDIYNEWANHKNAFNVLTFWPEVGVYDVDTTHRYFGPAGIEVIYVGSIWSTPRVHPKHKFTYVGWMIDESFVTTVF